MSDRYEESLSDEARDQAYFALFAELAERNDSIYEEQATQLLRDRNLTIRLEDVWLKYSLDRVGCSCSVSEDGLSFFETSWTRLGWRKKEKIERLPFFFAKTETNHLFKEV
jgi:hypothetical protein